MVRDPALDLDSASDFDLTRGLSRRGVLAVSAAGGLLAGCASVQRAGGGTMAASERVRVLNMPGRVFKLRDPGRENTESWLFHLVVETADGDRMEAASLELAHAAGAAVMAAETLGPAALAALRQGARTATTGLEGEPLPAPVFRQFFRVHATLPAALAVSETRVEMRLRDARGRIHRAAIRVAVGTYTPRTRLIFPFRGRGFVPNAQANDGGHPNRSGQFAIDALGVDENYAPVSSPDDVNTAYAGWGREIIAPADGTVVVARGDRPDQPVPNRSDPAFHAPEFPSGGDVGNHVVIDHGGGELSLVAHLMAGSVLVSAGERVRQGQPIGRLGNSGDSTGPHVHYQLQSGPSWMRADALPCAFANVSVQPLVRGTFFRAT